MSDTTLQNLMHSLCHLLFKFSSLKLADLAILLIDLQKIRNKEKEHFLRTFHALFRRKIRSIFIIFTEKNIVSYW